MTVLLAQLCGLLYCDVPVRGPRRPGSGFFAFSRFCSPSPGRPRDCVPAASLARPAFSYRRLLNQPLGGFQFIKSVLGLRYNFALNAIQAFIKYSTLRPGHMVGPNAGIQSGNLKILPHGPATDRPTLSGTRADQERLEAAGHAASQAGLPRAPRQ